MVHIHDLFITIDKNNTIRGILPAMTANREPFPVSDTAALVILWAGGYYEREPRVGTYLRRLDLSAGQELLERYNRICPWYGEVIINRKHFIKSTVEALVQNSAKPTCILNLGAGFSPLALELSTLLGDRTPLHRDGYEKYKPQAAGVLRAGPGPGQVHLLHRGGHC